MPDWSYQTVFRPLLFRLPARTARRLTLAAFGAIGRLPGGAFLIKTLGHQEASPLLDTGWSPTPVGLSGLIDPAGAARQGLARLGFGFVEVGPVTPLPIESAEPIGLDARREILRFPEPYENSGLQETVRRLSRPGHRLPQYVRIAPMPGSAPDEAKPQLQRMMRDLAPAGAAGFYVDAVIPEWDDAECAAVLNGLASWMAACGGECRRPRMSPASGAKSAPRPAAAGDRCTRAGTGRRRPSSATRPRRPAVQHRFRRRPGPSGMAPSLRAMAACAASSPADHAPDDKAWYNGTRLNQTLTGTQGGALRR